MPYDLTLLTTEDPETSATKPHWKVAQLGIDPDLVQAWSFLKKFCVTINSAAERKRQLPKETLLNAMASVMYRLIRIKRFKSTSINEAVRLGLLVFSSHIFLYWQDIKLPYVYLPDTYRSCLLNLTLPGSLPSQVLLWLLIIGSLAIFTPTDDVWLLPWARVNIELCQAHDWSELRGQLKVLPWIDFLHDEPGQAIFNAAVSSQTGSGTAP